MFLLQNDLGGLGALLHKLDRILGVDVYTGKKIALGNIGAQLSLVDVPVGIVQVAVIGNKANCTVFQKVLIPPVTQIAVDHNDLTFAGFQAVRAIIC